MVIELSIAFIFGLCLGCGIMAAISRPKISGVVNVDRSDPDGPYLFLELIESVNDLSTKEHVTFKVQNKNYISYE